MVCRVYNCLLFVLCCLLSVPCCPLFTAAYRCLTSSGHLPLYFARRKYSKRLDRCERGERKRAIRITHITPSFGTASTSSAQHPLCPAPAVLVPASTVLRFSCFIRGIDLQLSVRDTRPAPSPYPSFVPNNHLTPTFLIHVFCRPSFEA